MAKYFDTVRSYASDYLPTSVLSDGDIDFYVQQAERDVIAHYTRTTLRTPMMPTSAFHDQPGAEHLLDPNTDRKVYLRYYQDDAADIDESDTDEAAFLDAMRATIAEVALHRMSQADRTEGVVSESQGSRSVTYTDDARVQKMPTGFDRYLKPFDLRPASTYI